MSGQTKSVSEKSLASILEIKASNQNDMQDNSPTTLFRSIANRLVGHWYYFDQEGGFVFSLCHSEGEATKIRYFANNESYESSYTLFVTGQPAPVIILGDPDREPELSIKVLVRGTLILQDQKRNLHILERKADTSFANRVLASLENE